jgi:competence protein ComGC
MDQFHASRGFVLEVMVVVILVIELVFVFRGK